MDSAGAPFFMNGEAAWSLIVRLTPAEVERYLADRRARGVNTLLVNLIEHQFGGPANREGIGPFTTAGDFSTPDARYFDHAEQVIRTASDHGMLVLLAPAYLGYEGTQEGWVREMIASGPSKCREYGRFLGKRFRHLPNIVWVEGGDTRPKDARDEVEAIVAGIKELDDVHLHTAHSHPLRSAIDDYDGPWLDINTTYGNCRSVVELLGRDYFRSRTPFVFIEGTYENEHDVTLDCLIQQVYYPLLFGAAGHVFGNRPIWLFDPGWEAALDSPGSRLVQHLGTLLSSRQLHGLVPDVEQALVRGGDDPSDPDFVAAARSGDGRTALVFLPRGGGVTVDMGKMTAASVNAWWFDPRTGATSSAGALAGRGAHRVEAPAGAPWLLLLDDASRNLPAPGKIP